MNKRVSYHDVETSIVREYYFTAEAGVLSMPGSTIIHPSLKLLTFCVLVLRNGFTVTGEAACVDPESFDAATGRSLAREHAFSKCWPLLGYALKDEMHKEAK